MNLKEPFLFGLIRFGPLMLPVSGAAGSWVTAYVVVTSAASYSAHIAARLPAGPLARATW